MSIHNFLSFNNLKAWSSKHSVSEIDPVEDYFECITECSVNDKNCITRCRVLLE